MTLDGMNALRVGLLAVFAIATASCQPKPAPVATKVLVESRGFTVSGKSVSSTEQLIAELRSMPNLQAIHLQAAPGVSARRYEEASIAIAHSGLAVPIAFVGNEPFAK